LIDWSAVLATAWLLVYKIARRFNSSFLPPRSWMVGLAVRQYVRSVPAGRPSESTRRMHRICTDHPSPHLTTEQRDSRFRPRWASLGVPGHWCKPI